MLTLHLADRSVSVRHVRRGAFVVERAGHAARDASSPHEVGALVADALGIVDGALEPVRVTAECEGATAEITRAPGVAGFSLALRAGTTAQKFGVGRFEDAVARLLTDAPPWPESLSRAAPPLAVDPRFAFAAFAADPSPAVRAAELAAALTAHLDASGDPSRAWDEIIAALRALGHDLWSWDDRIDGSVWGSDYVTQRPGAGLQLTAWYPRFGTPGVEAEFALSVAGRRP